MIFPALQRPALSHVLGRAASPLVGRNHRLLCVCGGAPAHGAGVGATQTPHSSAQPERAGVGPRWERPVPAPLGFRLLFHRVRVVCPVCSPHLWWCGRGRGVRRGRDVAGAEGRRVSDGSRPFPVPFPFPRPLPFPFLFPFLSRWEQPSPARHRLLGPFPFPSGLRFAVRGRYSLSLPRPSPAPCWRLSRCRARPFPPRLALSAPFSTLFGGDIAEIGSFELGKPQPRVQPRTGAGSRDQVGFCPLDFTRSWQRTGAWEQTSTFPWEFSIFHSQERGSLAGGDVQALCLARAARSDGRMEHGNNSTGLCLGTHGWAPGAKPRRCWEAGKEGTSGIRCLLFLLSQAEMAAPLGCHGDQRAHP